MNIILEILVVLLVFLDFYSTFWLLWIEKGKLIFQGFKSQQQEQQWQRQITGIHYTEGNRMKLEW